MYRLSTYYLAKKDIDLADKALNFNLENKGAMELINDPEKLIEIGYEETKKLFN